MGKIVLILSLLLFAMNSTAAPSATLISGQVQVQADGIVLYKNKQLGQVTLPSGKLRLSVRKPTFKEHELLWIELAGTESRSATLLVTLHPVPQIIFNGITGPQGVDGEWSQQIQISSQGILLFQHRQDVQRCDGHPYYLFPRLFDFTRMQFRSVANIQHPVVQWPVIRATRQPKEAPRGEPLGTFQLTFASTQEGDNLEAGQLNTPLEAQDGRPDTSWLEGLGGAGRGEFFIARSLDTIYPLRGLRIIPGHAATPQTFAAANRIKAATLILSPTIGYKILFPQDPLRDTGQFQEPYWVFLPKPIATTCATFVIDEVYSGSGAQVPGGGQTAIAELRFLTVLDFQEGLARAVKDLQQQDPRRANAAEAVLGRVGDGGAQLLADRILKAEPSELRRIIRILSRINTPAAISLLVQTLPLIKDTMREMVFSRLSEQGEAVVPLLVPLLRGTDLELIRATAHSLGKIGGVAARESLLDLIGKGNEKKRAAITAGLGQLSRAADLQAVLEAVAGTREEARLSDLILVLGTLGKINPQTTCRLLQRLGRQSTSFEVRYRILQSLGRLDPESSRAYFAHSARDPDPHLRRIALQQLAKSPDVAARHLFLKALADPDPPVRTEAAHALLLFATNTALSQALAQQLHLERWGQVARALAEALGKHCGPAGIAELQQRVFQQGHDIDLIALNSLSRCAPPDIGKYLVAVGKKSTVRAEIRSRALTLLTPQAARFHADILIDLFSTLRSLALHSSADERVAVALTRPLALIGSPRATEALSEALALDPNPSIRTATAIALGHLCSPVTTQTLRRSLGDVSEAVRKAVGGAINRCNLKSKK